MDKIKVLIVDDHSIVREGIKSLIETNENIEIIGEASNGLEAIHRAESLSPDVILMDISMPIMSGIEATKALQRINPKIRVIVLSMHNSKEYIVQIIQSGAKGYLLKNTSSSELINAIQSVMMGQAFFSPEISQIVLNDYIFTEDNKIDKKKTTLSNRETEVLTLIAKGFSSKEIGELLNLSSRTIETHKEHIMKKLKVRTTAEIIKYAFEKKLL
jgi:two-component system, NarL family, nitrate/nitrite response regulator NarL